MNISLRVIFSQALGHGVQGQANAERLLLWTARITSSRASSGTFPAKREPVRSLRPGIGFHWQKFESLGYGACPKSVHLPARPAACRLNGLRVTINSASRRRRIHASPVSASQLQSRPARDGMGRRRGGLKGRGHDNHSRPLDWGIQRCDDLRHHRVGLPRNLEVRKTTPPWESSRGGDFSSGYAAVRATTSGARLLRHPRQGRLHGLANFRRRCRSLNVCEKKS